VLQIVLGFALAMLLDVQGRFGRTYQSIMSSWGVLVALCGYRADLPHNRMYFSPRIQKDDFRCFWSNGRAWGVYEQKLVDGRLQKRVETLYGEIGDMETVIES
jgi:hypothetical protein